MAATVSERKRSERQRKKDRGFISREIWIYPESLSSLKNFVRKLNEEDGLKRFTKRREERANNE